MRSLRELSLASQHADLGDRILAWIGVPALIAAALVIPTIAIDESSASSGWKLAAEIINWATWSVFFAELVVALAVSRNRRTWLRRHPLEIAVVVLTPPFLPAGLQALRVLRLLRILRLIAFARLARKAFSMDGLRAAAFLAVLAVLGGGAAFAGAERHRSLWDGIWWAITTMTTVGYGDLSPQTTLGRVVGILVMMVGIGFVAILTAALAERFVAGGAAQRTERDLIVELGATEDEIVSEIHDIARRLTELESAVRRLAAR
jgi:voltage-gated potassium channel